VIAITVRIVIFVPVFVVVMVRFTRAIVVMDVRMVSSTVAMIEGTHDIDRTRSNRKWSPHRRKENHLSTVRSTRCPDWNAAK
jgi:hypothetical protein